MRPDDHRSLLHELARDAVLAVVLLGLGAIALVAVALSHPRTDVPVNEVPARYRATMPQGTTSGTLILDVPP